MQKPEKKDSVIVDSWDIDNTQKLKNSKISGFNQSWDIWNKYHNWKMGQLPSEDEMAEIVWDKLEIALDKDTSLTIKGAEEITQILASGNVDKIIAKAIAKRIKHNG